MRSAQEPSVDARSEVRGQIRDRRARISTFAGLANKGVSVVSRLLTIPLCLSILGEERYGIWAAAWSLVNWLGLTDAGLGTGLINHLARAGGEEDRPWMGRLVSTAMVLQGGVAAAIAIAAIGLSRWNGIYETLGVAARPELWNDTTVLVLGAGVSFALTYSSNIVPQLCTALQQSYLAAAGQVIAGVGAVGLLAWLAWVHASPLVFALTQAIPLTVIYFLVGAYVLYRQHPHLKPKLSAVSMTAVRAMTSVGGMAFLIQLGDLAIMQSANLIIARRLGPSAVASFSIPYTLFFFGLSVVNTITAPLWPAYAEASARQDFEWIRRKVGWSVRVSGLAMVAIAAGLIALGPWFVPLWTHRPIVPSRSLLALLGIYFLVWSINGAVAIVASGLGLFRLRCVTVAGAALIFTALTWTLIPSVGLAAVPIAGIVALTVEGVVAFTQVRRRLNGAG